MTRKPGIICIQEKSKSFRLAQVNALVAPCPLGRLQSPHGDAPQSASGDASQIAPVRWTDVDTVPEHSEWDAVHFG